MTAFFEWLEDLPPSVWLAQGETIWSFATVLFLHSVGMGLSAGSAFMIGLRFIGAGQPMPLSSLRVLFRVFWAGVVLNFVTGSWLFATAASRTGVNPMYYAKLSLIVVGVLLALPLRRYVYGENVDARVPVSLKSLAAVSVMVWIAVITTGRLVAYIR